MLGGIHKVSQKKTPAQNNKAIKYAAVRHAATRASYGS